MFSSAVALGDDHLPKCSIFPNKINEINVFPSAATASDLFSFRALRQWERARNGSFRGSRDSYRGQSVRSLGIEQLANFRTKKTAGSMTTSRLFVLIRGEEVSCVRSPYFLIIGQLPSASGRNASAAGMVCTSL